MSNLIINPNSDKYVHSFDDMWKVRVGSILRLEIHENVDAKDDFRFYLVIVISTGGFERNILFEKYERKEEAEARRILLIEEIDEKSKKSDPQIII